MRSSRLSRVDLTARPGDFAATCNLSVNGSIQNSQLTVNLSKTKIVVFETRRSDCTDIIFNAKPVERVDSYRY